MKDISLYLSDITKIIKFSPKMENKRFEVYSSSLISSGQNCRVYYLETNTLWQEYIFSGYCRKRCKNANKMAKKRK